MSTAYAASAEGAAQAASMWAEPTIWVAVSFVIFVVLFAKPAWNFATSALDKRIVEIESSIEEATKLCEEAQDMLAGYKRKIAEAEQEAEDIVAQARDEAKVLKDRIAMDMETSLKRREKLAMDKIQQAETEATAEVRALTSEIALSAAHQLLADNVKGDKADELVDGAIQELPENWNSAFVLGSK